jgi:hypothetical protein
MINKKNKRSAWGGGGIKTKVLYEFVGERDGDLNNFRLISLLLLELVKNRKSLVHLGTQSLRSVEKMEQLRVVHLEQHARDLASQLRLGPR